MIQVSASRLRYWWPLYLIMFCLFIYFPYIFAFSLFSLSYSLFNLPAYSYLVLSVSVFTWRDSQTSTKNTWAGKDVQGTLITWICTELLTLASVLWWLRALRKGKGERKGSKRSKRPLLVRVLQWVCGVQGIKTMLRVHARSHIKCTLCKQINCLFLELVWINWISLSLSSGATSVS